MPKWKDESHEEYLERMSRADLTMEETAEIMAGLTLIKKGMGVVNHAMKNSIQRKVDQIHTEGTEEPEEKKPPGKDSIKNLLSGLGFGTSDDAE